MVVTEVRVFEPICIPVFDFNFEKRTLSEAELKDEIIKEIMAYHKPKEKPRLTFNFRPVPASELQKTPSPRGVKSGTGLDEFLKAKSSELKATISQSTLDMQLEHFKRMSEELSILEPGKVTDSLAPSIKAMDKVKTINLQPLDNDIEMLSAKLSAATVEEKGGKFGVKADDKLVIVDVKSLRTQVDEDMPSAQKTDVPKPDVKPDAKLVNAKEILKNVLLNARLAKQKGEEKPRPITALRRQREREEKKKKKIERAKDKKKKQRQKETPLKLTSDDLDLLARWNNMQPKKAAMTPASVAFGAPVCTSITGVMSAPGCAIFQSTTNAALEVGIVQSVAGAPAAAPTIAHAAAHTTTPAAAPTIAPAVAPTITSSGAPTIAPAAAPTIAPTRAPVMAPAGAFAGVVPAVTLEPTSVAGSGVALTTATAPIITPAAAQTQSFQPQNIRSQPTILTGYQQNALAAPSMNIVGPKVQGASSAYTNVIVGANTGANQSAFGLKPQSSNALGQPVCHTPPTEGLPLAQSQDSPDNNHCVHNQLQHLHLQKRDAHSTDGSPGLASFLEALQSSKSNPDMFGLLNPSTTAATHQLDTTNVHPATISTSINPQAQKCPPSYTEAIQANRDSFTNLQTATPPINVDSPSVNPPMELPFASFSPDKLLSSTQQPSPILPGLSALQPGSHFGNQKSAANQDHQLQGATTLPSQTTVDADWLVKGRSSDDLTLVHTPRGTGAGYGVGLDLDAILAESSALMAQRSGEARLDSAPLSASLIQDWLEVTGSMTARDLENLEMEMGSPMVFGDI